MCLNIQMRASQFEVQGNLFMSDAPPRQMVIAPSLLAANFTRFGAETVRASRTGAEWLEKALANLREHAEYKRLRARMRKGSSKLP